MKHIVFVIGNYKNGGVAMRSTNLANEFAKRGYSVTILVTKEIAKNIFFSLNENVEIVSLNNYIAAHSDDKKIVSVRKKRLNKICFLKKCRYVTRFIKPLDRKLDHVINGIRRSDNMVVYTTDHPESTYITFGLVCYTATYFALSSATRKIIYAERNACELEFPSDPIKKNRMINIVCNADGAVFQTKDEINFFEGKLKNATVINNPVKANLPEPYIGKRRNVIVNFCRISNQKNLPLLFEAFSLLRKSYPEYVLEIYGNTVAANETELLEKFKEQIDSAGMQKYIKLLPPRADVHEVIRDCKMFVSSSDFEGLSNSMIEAMAIGMPCVCTDCLGGGAREVINDGENGLLVPIKNAEALCGAMKRMIEDNELAEKCSANAAKIRDTHAVEKIAKKWLDYVNSVT